MRAFGVTGGGVYAVHVGGGVSALVDVGQRLWAPLELKDDKRGGDPLPHGPTWSPVSLAENDRLWRNFRAVLADRTAKVRPIDLIDLGNQSHGEGGRFSSVDDVHSTLTQAAESTGWSSAMRTAAGVVGALPEEWGGSEMDDETDGIIQELEDLASRVEERSGRGGEADLGTIDTIRQIADKHGWAKALEKVGEFVAALPEDHGGSEEDDVTDGIIANIERVAARAQQHYGPTGGKEAMGRAAAARRDDTADERRVRASQSTVRVPSGGKEADAAARREERRVRASQSTAKGELPDYLKAANRRGREDAAKVTSHGDAALKRPGPTFDTGQKRKK